MYSKILAGLISLSVIPLSALANPNLFQKIKDAKMNSVIDKTTGYLFTKWVANDEISLPPPQVIPIAAGTTVYGVCGSYMSGDDVGGSSYCPRTNTIFLVPEQLRSFQKEFGLSAIAYVVAHEFSHAIQKAYKIRLPLPDLELQADCMAGVMIHKGSEELGITREDTIAMSKFAYSSGDPTHGTGEQRAYALAVGMGVIKGSCEASEMSLLAEDKIDTSRFANTRSISRKVNLNATPYPKTILGSIGLSE
ncbi:neutral zinc metallopeptidase [Prochlorococcus marinus]|uniref:neutral zinc metallopeptidase n=1 Tax=Prochlorococcus marinus TaxID=1219 RepID=UPI0022B59392|nr:neutral zinc metallopeptidase [Prochlorococcus marinus]